MQMLKQAPTVPASSNHHHPPFSKRNSREKDYGLRQIPLKTWDDSMAKQQNSWFTTIFFNHCLVKRSNYKLIMTRELLTRMLKDKNSKNRFSTGKMVLVTQAQRYWNLDNITYKQYTSAGICVKIMATFHLCRIRLGKHFRYLYWVPCLHLSSSWSAITWPLNTECSEMLQRNSAFLYNLQPNHVDAISLL